MRGRNYGRQTCQLRQKEFQSMRSTATCAKTCTALRRSIRICSDICSLEGTERQSYTATVINDIRRMANVNSIGIKLQDLVRIAGKEDSIKLLTRTGKTSDNGRISAKVIGQFMCNKSYFTSG